MTFIERVSHGVSRNYIIVPEVADPAYLIAVSEDGGLLFYRRKGRAEERGEKKLREKTDLQRIPGIGKNMAEHLTKAGYPDIPSLKGQDPQEIYESDCLAQGVQVDRCVLYCYRLAVCFADNDGQLPPDKQNWWDWKD